MFLIKIKCFSKYQFSTNNEKYIKRIYHMKTFTFIVLLIAIFIITASTTKAQWVETSTVTYLGSEVRILCFTVRGTNLFVGTTSGVMRSTDNGTNWTDGVGDYISIFYIYALAVKETLIFAGTSSGGIYRSTDDGINWVRGNELYDEVISAICVNNTNLFAATYHDGVYRSTNDGHNWTYSGLYNFYVKAFCVSGTNLFAATRDNGVFLSTDNGTSWTATSLSAQVMSFVVLGTNIFAGTSGYGVILSTDNGTSWTEVNSGLTNTNVTSLVVSGTSLFAAISGSVFLSTNNGTSWTEVNSGLTNAYVTSLVVSGANLFAAASGGTVWRRPLSEIITSVEWKGSNLPSQFTLRQNYPNPFNPTTKINYEIPKTSFVSLIVYNVLGKEVAELVNEEKAAGSYEVDFNAANLSSGVYFYKIQTGDFVETKKMVVMK